MKILSIEKNKFKSKGYVTIAFNEKIEESRFIINDKKETLEIKILEKEKLNWRYVTLLSRSIVFFAKKHKIKKIVLDWDIVSKLHLGNDFSVAEIFAINFEMANYEFISFKSKPKEGWNFIDEICILIGKEQKIETAIKKGQLIGKEINACRELANTPGANMTPEILVEETKKAIKNTKLKMKILNEKEMQKLGMNSILAVARGSKEKPKFIILENSIANKKEKPVVLIGKGVTFDSGGLNIKTGDMSTMNMDMSGGAAIIHTLILAAKLGIKNNVIGLIPVVESMPSGESLRPGDIIKSMSGKTIEVQNTDAEGRIILADAHTFAERYDPKLVVTVSTLTGAASVALGERASALLTKNEKLSRSLCSLAEESGDYIWPLPLWDEYEAEIKGNNGDICNIRNRQNTREGGTILGGMFIYQFAKKFPLWAHIDIAPRMIAVDDEFLAYGAAGTPVRLLIKLLEKFKNL